jgi:general stress protein 26
MAEDTPDELKQKFWDAMAADPVVVIGLVGSDKHHVPMRAQLDKSAHGQVWFFTSRDHALAAGGACHASYIADGHKLYASLRGRLSEERDEVVIDKHWNNAVAAWYDGGRKDPDMILLRLDIADVEIWTADPSIKGMFKMLTGMKISPQEIGSHAEMPL